MVEKSSEMKIEIETKKIGTLFQKKMEKMVPLNIFFSLFVSE